MSFYETLYIVDPNLENKTLEKTIDEVGKELKKTKAKIINHRIWGKKKLAYPIDRQKYGSFIIMQFEGGDQEKMNEYEAWMRLNNSVLRHMTVLLNEKPEVYLEEKEPKKEHSSDGLKNADQKTPDSEANSPDKNKSSSPGNQGDSSGDDLNKNLKEEVD